MPTENESIEPGKTLLHRIKNKELPGGETTDLILRLVLMFSMSGGGAALLSEGQSGEITQLKAEVAALKADQASKWRTYYSRRREAQAEHVCYERRFTRLEARARIEAPACQYPHADSVEPEPAAPAEAPPRR